VFPHALPGGKYFAFTIWGQTQGIGVFPLGPDAGDWSLVLPQESFTGSLFASTGGPDGRLFVVTQEADVKAAAFNAVRPARVNAEASVLSGVYFDQETESQPWLAVSNSGTAVYAAANPAIGRVGHAQPVQFPRAAYATQRGIQPQRQQNPRVGGRLPRPRAATTSGGT
jgi:hypothetical protein